MKNLFFYKLYVLDKRLFFLVAIFCGLTVFFNISGDEITPFFIWAMYSEKEPALNTYEVFQLRVNDGQQVDYTSGFTDNNRFFLLAPLSYYNKTVRNNFDDPTVSFIEKKLGEKYRVLQPLAERIYNGNKSTKQFPEWLAGYLQQSIKEPVRKLQVDVLTCHFTADHQVQQGSRYSLIRWEQQ